MEHELLKDLVLILGVSALSIFVLYRFRVPSTVGFIIAGIVIGPYGLGLIKDAAEVEMLAEGGVILLLFTVGIEFSLKKLVRIKKIVLFSGGGQVLLTIAITAGSTMWFSHSLKVSIFFGFLTALSSTAIVLKSLSEGGEMDSPHGNLMLGVLIFQDLCVVPMLLMTPVLGGESMDTASVVAPLAKAAIVIILTLLSARWIFPRLLHRIVHTRSRELFLITIILSCFGIALLTSHFGLSLALGAFLAGLIISESEYAHQATAEILPFKETFLGLFFVSIGMLMDIGYIASNPILVFGAVSLLFSLKLAGAFFPLAVFSSSPRASAHAALGIAQIGEFSFVLAETGRSAGLMPEGLFQLFLSASVTTMAATPFILRWAFPLTNALASWFPAFKPDTDAESISSKVQDHVLIVGFGLNGKNLAMTLKRAGITYTVLEMNSNTVSRERKRGEPIVFGDATSSEVLKHMGIYSARSLVIAISDPAASRKITSTARLMNPNLHIIVRTRYLSEVEDLKAIGANEVVPEEFETSVEIFSRVLNRYEIPRNVIGRQIDDIRRNTYSVLRSHSIESTPMTDLCSLSGSLLADSFLIMDGSPASGKTIKDLSLRNLTGATIIAIKRSDTLIQNPSPNEILRTGDIIVFIGNNEQVGDTVALLEAESTE